jgi:exopolyphosphatase/guanosine-5'-triphosphate,3'-diphosphate pyrophosphatase
MNIKTFLAASALLTGQVNAAVNVPYPISSIERTIVTPRDTKLNVVTRASLDIGSGLTKITVADVDLETNTITEIWYRTFVEVPLRRELVDGYLTERVEALLVDTLKTMQENARQFNPTEWSGIATSVFRTAKNGQEFLDRVKSATGIALKIIPQKEEAKIGFTSAAAISNIPADNIISWDSGSGSFQISTLINGNLEMYGAEFALVPTVESLFNLRNQPYLSNTLINPVSESEALSLIEIIKSTKLPEVPTWLSENGNNKSLVAIGDKSSIFNTGKIAVGHSPYTKQEILDAIIKNSGKRDDELTEFYKADEVMIGLILVYSVMDHCQIDQVNYFNTNGSCEGLLISADYWNN